MKKVNKVELITGILLMVVSLGYFLMSFSIPVREGVPSPRLIPQLVGGMIFVLSASLVVKQVKVILQNKRAAVPAEPQEGSAEAAAEEDGGIKSNYKRVALTLVFLAIYCLCFEPVGFLLSSFALLFAEMFLLSDKEWRTKKRVILMFIISFVAAVALYLVFRYALSVMLPQGILKGLL